MARALRCALYATARNGVFSAGTLATLARWLKSVGRRCVPTSAVNGSKSPVAKWLGAGNCPEPAHQGASRRAGPCPARRVPPSCRGALLAVRDAEPLPELHAARPAARLHAELLHVRRESLRGMPGAHTRAKSRMSKAADLYPPPAGVFHHFDLAFLHRITASDPSTRTSLYPTDSRQECRGVSFGIQGQLLWVSAPTRCGAHA
jgi:hypothetical protein